MPDLDQEIRRRRTFAIISHPDAGKTTLTEKLLLYGGAIQLAGEVKAKASRRQTRSDWMNMERERGISIVTSVMTFEYADCVFNLLDTPGHEDFSEDTYRVLTAVDSALMVIDSSKGIETQTKKLFQVCRDRHLPILTFMNKVDLEGRDPFELIDEVEQVLKLPCFTVTWPVGQGSRFKGVYDLMEKKIRLFQPGKLTRDFHQEVFSDLDDPALRERVGAEWLDKLKDDLELLCGAGHDFDAAKFLAGNLSPVFFGSAVNNFGVQELLDAFARYAPSPRPRQAEGRQVRPDEEKFSGLVFKIQANMDPRHRDRIAFARICSGRFERGMKLFHPRSGKSINVHTPVMFLAREREIAEEAFPGDIVGIPNHGQLRIGDALTEGEALRFTGIPSFAPELLQKVRAADPLRSKHLGKALTHLAEEGAAQVFKTRIGGEWIVGVAGPLQFDVLADRIRTEYDLPVSFQSTTLHTARWIEADDRREL
ncbi:MAG: peptide chain release factor 3, partial [Thermoanaerobaculia bacterium]|nr:peptide chain release factor 3 [Thermoanaerobaculia bacterium]